MSIMHAVQVSSPGGELESVERPVPDPGPGQVRVRVRACGICHGDAHVKEGDFPGIDYPRVPGHEIAGVIDALGTGVDDWRPGQRVGVGWNGGFCGGCANCRHGEFFACATKSITGITRDGGYAEYLITSASALAQIPDELDFAEAAPLMCAGMTTFNSLRHCGAPPGALVAVLGIGGLGHLGIQYAVSMGYRTVAIARGTDKAAQSLELGAFTYIDSTAQDPAAELQELGGADVILATVTNGEAMSAVQGGLALNGTLLLTGSPQAMQISPRLLIMGRRSVKGWASGTAVDARDTLLFSAQNGVRARTENYPLERAAEAYARMAEGKARFRVVLTMD